MENDTNVSIRVLSVLSYIITITVIIVAYVYTVHGFKIIEADALVKHFENFSSVILLVLSWGGVLLFLGCSILLTYVWIDEKREGK
ncbi:TPA: hypothetical protein OZI11_002479 [Staphylococcus aureus]|nr:hypothetical protein [Staphylococcus aureus]